MQRTLFSNGKIFTPQPVDFVEGQGFRWVDIQDPDEEELQALEKGFGFHPLAVEDCRHLDQRSKVEEYGTHTFVVLHVYATTGKDPTNLRLHELHMFVAPQLLVTVHAEPMTAVELVWDRAVKGDSAGAREPGALLHRIADAMVDEMYPAVDALTDLADEITEEILHRAAPGQLKRLADIKRAVSLLRRLTPPAREVLNVLAHERIPGIDARDAVYFRDVLDHLSVLQQRIDTCREFVGDARDLYLAAQGARTNEVMKRLTVMATLGLPLTFLSGFFGMNFTAIPFHDPRLLYAAGAAMIGVPLGMLAFFKWRNWV
ncbi:MAG: magnesium transporter CorA family protein [Myxococcota bacterium]